MPVKITGDEMSLNHFKASVESIKKQTDSNWKLVIVDDYSDDRKVYEAIDEVKKDLGEKLHIIYSDRNYGTGQARNTGIRYAAEIGAPFILYNDSDDISDPLRLELVRRAFDKDDTVNVVYTGFDVIDENGKLVPRDQISLSVREIIDGHKQDIVEGENAWIAIAMKKKYTNLTSCTAVKTSLALAEPFPAASVSEDCHTWLRYAAHPGKFVFIREIKGGYRICTGVQSRSRSINADFYEKMFQNDSAGFEEAVKIAKKYGTMGGFAEDDIRVAFYVRLALTLLHGRRKNIAKSPWQKRRRSQKKKRLPTSIDCPVNRRKKIASQHWQEHKTIISTKKAVYIAFFRRLICLKEKVIVMLSRSIQIISTKHNESFSSY